MEHLIKATGISKTFGKRKVINTIDFEIKKGEVLALIGSNGAGKSTLISLLLGMNKPDCGETHLWRHDFKNHIGVQLQTTPFFEGYTTLENLSFFTALYNVKLSKAEKEEILESCRLLDAKNTLASQLSLGQQKRLSIAITTIHSPELVILDEPSAGLDPKARKEIHNLITQLSNKDVTILFSSHDMDEVLNLADRLVFLHNGEVLEEGNPTKLLTKYNVDTIETLYLHLIDKKEVSK